MYILFTDYLANLDCLTSVDVYNADTVCYAAYNESFEALLTMPIDPYYQGPPATSRSNAETFWTYGRILRRVVTTTPSFTTAIPRVRSSITLPIPMM